MTTTRTINTAIVISFFNIVPCLGQANYSAGFDNNAAVQSGADGPQNLISAGWIFRNQSAPLATGTWHNGYNDWFAPQAGAGYLSVGSESTDFLGGDVSQWAILPAIPNQQAGDILAFYVRRFSSSNADTLQVRYAPGGGTSTGSGANGIGNFTTLLADLNPIPLTGWTLVSVTVPGTGRLAIRFYADNACNFSCFASYVGIDSLTVKQAPPAGPPLPGPGQTTHWTTSISPVVINTDTAIVAGGTVIVDPGVQVQIQGTAVLYVLGSIHFDPGAALSVSSTGNLRVEGTGEFLGTAASPVTMTGGVGGAFAKGIEAAPGGTVRLDHVTSDLPVYVHPNTMIYGENTNTIVIDHSTFTGDGDIRAGNGHLAIRNTTINGPAVRAQETYLLLDHVTLDNSTLETARRKAGQPVYFNEITALNCTVEAPFLLSGFDHFFGSNNTISNNLYPVHLIGGGVARGSVLPAFGNTHNYVHGGIGEFIGRVTFANTGIPYRLDFDSSAPVNEGELTIEPGATLKLGPGAYVHSYVGGTVIAEGLPNAPITFERLDPAQPWRSISFRNSRRPKMEYCVASGADWAFGADETVVRLESCRLQGNAEGASAYSFGRLIARKCEFLDNSIGVRTSPGAPVGFGGGTADLLGGTNPNSFVDNALAVDAQNPLSYTVDAKDNWWNDSTGPQNPYVVPFRDSPPDFMNHPPIVRLQKHSFLLEEGQKVILHWDAQDDDGITGYRLLYSPHGENPGLSLLMDGIPGSARSVEVVVPQAPPSSNTQISVLRVVAIDAAGQEGWDEIQFETPYVDFAGKVIPQPITGTFRPGQHTTVCYNVVDGASGGVDAYLFADGDNQVFSLGGAHTGINCLSGTITIPPVSTDTARVGLRYGAGAGGRDRWEFTDVFSIRPDPLVGDAPPTVQMLTPNAGQSLTGGSVVPITWSASDDEALRSFDIQASYDAGRTWHVVVRDLPANSTAYNWRLPGSTRISDVRLRVVARDLRFQNTSAESGSFTITPGMAILPGDVDGNGTINLDDMGLFIQVLLGNDLDAAHILASDLNADAVANGLDAKLFVAAMLGG